MKKLTPKKLLILPIIIILITLILVNININKNDILIYQDNKYIYLEYNHDIFNYDLNESGYYEIDMIHKISHNKWDIIYLNGDLFVVDKQVKKATNYYANDKNYNWYFILEEADEEPISITNKELNYLYSMDDQKKEKAIHFDQIEKMGTLKKKSKDGFISAIITLAYYNDNWYWRTEIMDDTTPENCEYVIELPKTLTKKINNKLKDKATK